MGGEESQGEKIRADRVTTFVREDKIEVRFAQQDGPVVTVEIPADRLARIISALLESATKSDAISIPDGQTYWAPVEQMLQNTSLGFMPSHNAGH